MSISKLNINNFHQINLPISIMCVLAKLIYSYEHWMQSNGWFIKRRIPERGFPVFRTDSGAGTRSKQDAFRGRQRPESAASREYPTQEHREIIILCNHVFIQRCTSMHDWPHRALHKYYPWQTCGHRIFVFHSLTLPLPFSLSFFFSRSPLPKDY